MRKHQTLPKQYPQVRNCGHISQPIASSSKSIKTTFATTPNLPSYSFPKNNLTNIQKKCPHGKVAQFNKNQTKMAPNNNKQPASAQVLFKKCGHVNRNFGMGSGGQMQQKVLIPPQCPHKNIQNVNNIMRSNTYPQNLNNFAVQKMIVPPVPKRCEHKNVVQQQPQQQQQLPQQQQQQQQQQQNTNKVQRAQKSRATNSNVQPNKNKDTKSMPPEGKKPAKNSDNITEIYKRKEPIHDSSEDTTNVKPSSSEPPNTENLNFQKVTQELASIIKNFQKQIHDVPLAKSKLEEIPSAMIQPKIKEFFKKPGAGASAQKQQQQNKNQTNNNNKNPPAQKQQQQQQQQQNKNQTNNNNNTEKNQTVANANNMNNIKKQTSLKSISKPGSLSSSTLDSLKTSPSNRKIFHYGSSLLMDPLTQLKNEVHKAIRERKTFTVRGHYGPIRRALLSRGWVEKFHISYKDHLNEEMKRYQNYPISELLPLLRREDLAGTCKNLIKSKLLGGYQVDFYWGTNDEAFKENPDKIKLTTINKLKREIFSYTNKQGLCDASKNSYWYQKSNVSKLNHPRSYSLGKNGDLKGFIDDFNVTAAMSLLKWVVKTNMTKESKLLSPSGKVPLETFDFALNECCKFIKKGRHEDIDMRIPEATEHEWTQFLDYFYKIIHYSNHFKAEGKETEESLVKKSNYILNNLRSFYPYLDMDGMMNIWILKPVASSRGRGIHMCRTLPYVLKIVKQNNTIRYVIQKYIERPLLIYNTKFDIRQWFLISNCSPLTIWMYKECYLRFSSQTYNLRKLHESIHLTNNSVQCKYKNNSCDTALPSYNMWDSNDFQRYLGNIGYPKAFKDIVYPGMKQSITAAVLMHQDKMVIRKNCFELFGADFILTEDFQPWLLEINSNPALYGSTPVTARMCPRVLEDVIKVVVDYSHNAKANTGSFEMVYKEQVTKLPTPGALELKGLPLQSNYFFNAPDQELKNVHSTAKNNKNNIIVNQTQDCLKMFGDEIKKTLKNLLDLIHKEKEKREQKQPQKSQNLKSVTV